MFEGIFPALFSTSTTASTNFNQMSLSSTSSNAPVPQGFSPPNTPPQKSYMGSTTTTTTRPTKSIYTGLSSEAAARVAVFHACSITDFLLTHYRVHRVIGFGANGTVLAATTTTSSTPVAIKIIYKHHQSPFLPIPPEIEALRDLHSSPPSPSHLLTYLTHWQDLNNYYLVTNIFGSNWLSGLDTPDADALRPVQFSCRQNGIPTSISVPMSTGCSDLWSWSYAHRSRMFATEGHSILPLHPVKRIVHQLAAGLHEMHVKGYYHGDVKIENVLVESSRGVEVGPNVVLADFGHTRHVVGGVKAYGTPQVSAPEFLSDAPFDKRVLDGRAADVFALGMVLFVLLNASGEVTAAMKQVMAGRMGYAELVACDYGDFPLESVPDLEEDGWDVLYGMTHVDPTARISIEQVLAHPFFA
ncbi:hypothetical protein HDU98_008635 [Podochytrium sp. JEL0797]|nr:hypothetical protein HDU98_008635 [Podochytrium sp. JEL0797]